jgi:integrase/recombinase XerD
MPVEEAKTLQQTFAVAQAARDIAPADVLRTLLPGLSVHPFQFPSLQHLDERIREGCAAALGVDGLSEASTTAYATAYGRFRAYLTSERLAERFITGQLDEQRRILENWIAWLRMSGANHTTVNTYFRGLHALFTRIARTDGLVDPTALVVAPRPGRPHTRFLTKNALEDVFAFVRNYQWLRGSFVRDRNVASIAMMALGGCRLGEVIRLDVADVDLSAGTIRVKKGKGRRGGKPRTVYMPPALHAALRVYLAARAHRDLATPRLLVSAFRDAEIRAGTIRRLCRTITDRTGIKVAPHLLRHTAATLMRQSGVVDRLAMDQLGHASLVALQRYSHVANGELREAITKVDVDIGIA